MTDKTYDRQDAERMMPLLRSIGREIRERTRALALLKSERSGASGSSTYVDSLQRQLDPLISLHRRELRRIRKELSRLGCDLDSEHPLRILISGAEGAWAYEGRLDETNFRTAPADVRA